MDTEVMIGFAIGVAQCAAWALAYGAGKIAGRKEEAERPRSLVEMLTGETVNDREERQRRAAARLSAIARGEDVDEGRR